MPPTAPADAIPGRRRPSNLRELLEVIDDLVAIRDDAEQAGYLPAAVAVVDAALDRAHREAGAVLLSHGARQSRVVRYRGDLLVYAPGPGRVVQALPGEDDGAVEAETIRLDPGPTPDGETTMPDQRDEGSPVHARGVGGPILSALSRHPEVIGPLELALEAIDDRDGTAILRGFAEFLDALATSTEVRIGDALPGAARS